MKIIRILILFISLSAIAQQGSFIYQNDIRNLKILLNKEQTHCLLWLADGKSYGLIYDLQTGEQVKEVIFTGYTSDSNFKPHVFDYYNNNAIIAGWDNNNLQSERYFIWDEASNKFYNGDELPAQHGIINDVIGDEIVFSFTIYAKNSKGQLNLKKPQHSFVQFYNWKTKKWRGYKHPYKVKDNLYSKSLILFEDGSKIKYLDLKSLQFLNTTSPGFDNIVTNFQDGNVYAAKYNKGIDKVALFDVTTLKVGSFSKAPSHNNLDYYWGEMTKHHVKLEKNNNEIDLVITNKQTKDTKKNRITTSNKDEAEIISQRVNSLKELRQNKSKQELNQKYASQIAEMKEWEINFQTLPKNYTHNYKNVKGTDITSLKMSKRLYLSSKSTVYAIGKVFECEESKVFLVMLRGPSAEGTESVYALLKTDHYGNRLQYQIVARSVSNNIGYIQMDQFSITTYLNNNTTIDVVENYMGKETKRQYKMYCIN